MCQRIPDRKRDWEQAEGKDHRLDADTNRPIREMVSQSSIEPLRPSMG